MELKIYSFSTGTGIDINTSLLHFDLFYLDTRKFEVEVHIQPIFLFFSQSRFHLRIPDDTRFSWIPEAFSIRSAPTRRLSKCITERQICEWELGSRAINRKRVQRSHLFRATLRASERQSKAFEMTARLTTAPHKSVVGGIEVHSSSVFLQSAPNSLL